MEALRAADELLPLLYDELRRLARTLAPAASPGDTLQPTALVHEAYLRLTVGRDPGWQGRGHFFGAAARAMRRIIVDHARRKGAAKRGGGRERLDIDDLHLAMPAPPVDVLALEEALGKLEQGSPRAARIVEHRFFAGLTAEETAESLGISRTTVERDWRYARAFLRTILEDGDASRT